MRKKREGIGEDNRKRQDVGDGRESGAKMNVNPHLPNRRLRSSNCSTEQYNARPLHRPAPLQGALAPSPATKNGDAWCGASPAAVMHASFFQPMRAKPDVWPPVTPAVLCTRHRAASNSLVAQVVGCPWCPSETCLHQAESHFDCVNGIRGIN